MRVKLHRASAHFTPKPPFDFTRTLDFIDGFRPAMGEHRREDATLTKALAVDGQTVVFRLHDEGSIDVPRLACTLYAEAKIAPALKAAALDRVCFYLSLDEDLAPFYALARGDEAFAPVLDALYGYHQVKFPSAFENAVWALLSQRNLMSVSGKMKRALTERFGSQLEVDGVVYTAFPDAARLAAATSYEVAETIGHGAKAALIVGAAQAFDRVDERWLRDAPREEVEAWLRSIKGIGVWSSTFVLLRALGRTERLPVNERRTLEAAALVYGQFSIDDEALYRLGERYGPYIGLWAHYLRASM